MTLLLKLIVDKERSFFFFIIMIFFSHQIILHIMEVFFGWGGSDNNFFYMFPNIKYYEVNYELRSTYILYVPHPVNPIQKLKVSTVKLLLGANAPLGPASSEGLYVCMSVTL